MSSRLLILRVSLTGKEQIIYRVSVYWYETYSYVIINELALRMIKTVTGSDEILVSKYGYHGNSKSCINISSYKFVGEAETSVSYSWTQAADSDIADGFRSDDYGALTEPVLRTEDRGNITDLDDIPAWHPAIDDWGVITEDETVKAYGQKFIKGSAKDSFSPAPHVHSQLEGFNASPPKYPRLLGTGKDYPVSYTHLTLPTNREV